MKGDMPEQQPKIPSARKTAERKTEGPSFPLSALPIGGAETERGPSPDQSLDNPKDDELVPFGPGRWVNPWRPRLDLPDDFFSTYPPATTTVDV